jgi:hypothetical protein
MLTACGALLGLMVAASGTVVAGMPTNDMTYLTFSGPVRLPGVTLGAGTYVFERVDGKVDVVRVLSKQRSQLYLQAFTRQVSRPAGLRDDRMIVFQESPRGVAPAIDAWYPIGSARGHQFIYHDSR